ncbi:MAG: hypothetical protein ABJP48_01505 [Erythrobacter sp.]
MAALGLSRIPLSSYNKPAADLALDASCDELVRLLSSGGDARISLNPKNGLNKYFSAPYPRDLIAYSSSTVNDVSASAFAHLRVRLIEIAQRSYADLLEGLRRRLSAAYALPDATEIVFAASGTDLEYVALACVLGKGRGGIHNVLLGADEIGSGCIHSAHGRFFARETALGLPVEQAAEVQGCGSISLVDVPVRCSKGLACESQEIFEAFAAEILIAKEAGKHCLIHLVHGSKTGLVLPELSDLEALQNQFPGDVTFVVDACQARITSEAIGEYLKRGCIVLLTGSKFMGGPPFNGFALIPKNLAEGVTPLPSGFAQIFNRAEFPASWPGCELLPDNENRSLAMRLEAAIFELERFQSIPIDRVETMIAGFEEALHAQIIEPLGIERVAPNFASKCELGSDRPIEMRTLATLDVSMLPGLRTFEDAQKLHRDLAFSGIRLGQPVKCSRRIEGGKGEWGGTLRIGLSMPIMNEWAKLDQELVAKQLADDFAEIAERMRLATLSYA